MRPCSSGWLDCIKVSDRFAFFVARWLPAPVQGDGKERFRALLGAGLGILLTALVSRWLQSVVDTPVWLIAPMGASAVLVFAVPGSPMAQPWAVVGGSVLSAVAGVVCAHLPGDPAWAAAVAVGASIGLMYAARCLHPPGSATALLAVLTHTTGYGFVLFPVLTNAMILVAFGVLYNRFTGRPYPHRPNPPASGQDTDPAARASRFSSADLDAALKHYNQVLDISRADLQALLHHAELAAYQRNLGELTCGQIMSREPHAVQFGTDLAQAWSLMREKKVKALPVIDRARRIVGIVTVADFLRHANLETVEGLGGRLRTLVQRSGVVQTDKPEVVGQIMTRSVRVASVQRHVIELVPLFSQGSHHHIPIIDDERRLVGMITQSDLVRTLYRAVQPEN